MNVNVDLLSIVVERERKKAEKQAKFDQKKAEQAAKKSAASAAPSKKSEKRAQAAEKAEAEVLPEYVEDTPIGEKKSVFNQNLGSRSR